ncbi:MAG: aminotransferase class I/II-fold pyridoxal phosphate-dependent enzyme [Clostridiales bacterium]|jgi:DNA-binding transcriptional MocR family regulator|nr:aminotransferase class I/II-fold pyridoxal phosphate-dependent enzyme [Clostridiales bacterium]
MEDPQCESEARALQAVSDKLRQARLKYEKLKALGASLDMTRGKPGADQLDLSQGLFECLRPEDYKTANGVDCRNYGGLDGIPEIREIFADLLEVPPSQVIAAGNSSLSLMYGAFSELCAKGVSGEKPWLLQSGAKFICPAPGYDRHFAICEHFGIKMETVGLSDSGPDMDAVEALAKDASVKGMWCVPVFSNPTGCVYSAETVKRLASLNPAAKDFRLFWDDAYFIHQFGPKKIHQGNILKECEACSNPDLALVFASFSKVTFPGASVAAVAASKANLSWVRNRMSKEMVGPDKLNQLRHARFFKNADGVLEHMQKMSNLLKPKFDTVLSSLERNLSGACTWSKPEGGYFISLNTPDGCAKRAIELSKEAGVAVTGAGATFPYGVDPRDRNIRLAPSFPALGDLKLAVEIFCAACNLAALEKEAGI